MVRGKLLQANVKALHKSPERNLIAKKLLLFHSSFLCLTSMLLYLYFLNSHQYVSFFFLSVCFFLRILHCIISHPASIFSSYLLFLMLSLSVSVFNTNYVLSQFIFVSPYSHEPFLFQFIFLFIFLSQNQSISAFSSISLLSV